MDNFASIFSSTTSKRPLTAAELGTQSILSLLLDTHQTEIFASERGSFWLKLSQVQDQFDVPDDSSLLIQPGETTTIYFTYSLREASSAAALLGANNRECRLENEMTQNSEKFFLKNSRRSCIYACALRRAKAELVCIPWNIFSFEEEVSASKFVYQALFRLLALFQEMPLPVCLRSRSLDFEEMLTSPHFRQLCQSECPPDCSELGFSLSKDSFVSQPQMSCQHKHVMQAAMKNIQVTSAVNIKTIN